MFKYKNDKGIMCIVDTSANKEYRLSMPHEVVEVVAILNAAQQSVQPTKAIRCACGGEMLANYRCQNCGLASPL